MKSLFRRHILFVLALLLLVLGFSVRYLPEQGRKDDELTEGILSNIRYEVSLELKRLDRQMLLLRNVLQQGPKDRFSQLVDVAHLPTYLYRDSTLFFWSDFRFIPEYDALRGDYQRYKLLWLKNGKFITCKTHFSEPKYTEVYCMAPIFSKYSIENSYLTSGWLSNTFRSVVISPYRNPDERFNIYAPNNDFLFAVEMLPGAKTGTDTRRVVANFLLLMGIVFLSGYVIRWVQHFTVKMQYGRGLALLAGYFFGLRASMLLLNFPMDTGSIDLFSARHYASTAITPSLGDLLLNMLLLGILLWYFFRYFFKSILYRNLLLLPSKGRVAVGVCVVALSYLTLYATFQTLRSLYFNAQWTLDITSSLDFSFFKIVALFIFILISLLFFFFTHTLSVLFLRLTIYNGRRALSWFLVGTLGYLTLAYVLNGWQPVIFLLSGAYFLLIYFMRFPKYLNKLRYQTYIYFFTGAVVCAAIGAFSLYSFNRRDTLMEKQKFATQLISESDMLGEYLLKEASDQIRNDDFIRSRLLNPFASKALIEQKIKRAYIGSYFDKYDVQVIVFNAEGSNFSETADADEVNYFNLLRKYNRAKYHTAYPKISFLNEFDKNIFKRYLSFIEISEHGMPLGYIVIDLKLKRIIPGSVYPELLVDKKFTPPFQSKNYSYAIYSDQELLYNFGTFNYEKELPPDLLQSPELYEEGINGLGVHHLGVKGSNNKTIVVTSDLYPTKNMLANFSFLFLILIIVILSFIISYLSYQRVLQIHLNLATKIQIYLNAAFFLPLITVSIITLSVIGTSYKNDLNKLFIRRTETVSNNIGLYLEKFTNGQISLRSLDEAVALIAKHTDSDINLFNTAGRLIVSSQPRIYEKDILSTYINPKALADIVESRRKVALLPESVGLLRYNTVYAGIRSSETGKLIGIVSVPFFESKSELNKQITDVVSTILNIFAAIFLLFLILSYFASQMLVVPLKMITHKLRRTTLEKNEPLEWYSRDEIGLMVNEYNQMLRKLEASRDALSRTEKESAWREMAQQVAHEIKNPLTPMKLTLQHLQRAIREGRADVDILTERAVNTLLTQVDNLNDIATSFSAFAKMPIPKNEFFDVVQTLQQTVELYKNDQDMHLIAQIEPQHCIVHGDEKLMSRIFTNLIINAKQAVHVGKMPEIEVKLQQYKPQTVLIEVKDNGTGIPTAIQDKIFMPNFSTKTSGSGIGLAVAKRGVEHAGGKIWFETTEGHGTVFCIELPIMSV